MDKLVCIYHANCVDGFTAAWAVSQWAVRNKLNPVFIAGNYGTRPAYEEFENAIVILVDFSYPKDVIDRMAEFAKQIIILDHHKTAQEALAGYPKLPSTFASFCKSSVRNERVVVLFDMERSGAGITWDFFFSADTRPDLIHYVEDYDIYRLKLSESKEYREGIGALEFDFGVWTSLAYDPDAVNMLKAAGRSILRAKYKSIRAMIKDDLQHMVIGGITVPVLNVPYAWASETGNILSEGVPFAATYVDGTKHRKFSLRSQADGGADVSAIAKLYGGGGHKNASGFYMPHGWSGDK